MTVSEIVIAKLGGDYPLVVTDVDIDMAIEEVEVEIKGYCNINTIPETLKFVEANMCVDYLRWQTAIRSSTGAQTQPSENLSVSQLGEVQLGNMTFKLNSGIANTDTGSSMNPRKSHIPKLDTILMNYVAQLNRYRNPLNGGL